jgi:hypothetical protein
LLSSALVVSSLSGLLPQVANAASQGAYRWRNDDGTEAAATWAAAENTAMTGFTKTDIKRLRFGVKADTGETPEFQTVATLASIGVSPIATCVDSAGGYAYTADSSTSPATVYRVKTSDLSVTSLTLPTGRNSVRNCAVDRASGSVYFVTRTTPSSYLVKVDLATFSQVTDVALPSVNGNTVFIDGAYAYVANFVAGTPSTLYKVRLSDMVSVASLPLAGYNSGVIYYGATDGVGNLYYGTRTAAGVPGAIIRIDMATLTVTGTLTLTSGAPSLPGFGDAFNSVVYYGGNLYAQTWGTTVPNYGRIVRVNVASFTQTGAIDSTDINGTGRAAVDSATGILYLGSNGVFTRFDLKTFTHIAGTLTFANSYNVDIDASSGYLYGPIFTNPGTYAKVSIAPHRSLRLEVAPKAASCAASTGWAQVTSVSSPFQLAQTSYASDLALTTNVAGGVTDAVIATPAPFVPGRILGTSSSASVGLSEGAFTELEYAVTPTAGATDGATYCFRVTDGGTALAAYSSYAEATVAPSNLATLSNSVTLGRLAAGSTGVAVSARFTLQSPASTQLTVTFPSGFAVTSPFTSGTCTSGTIGSFAMTGTTLTAVKSSCSGTVTLSGATVSLPSAAGAYTINWVNDDPGSATVIVVSNDQIDVAATVDPSIAFDVGAASSCDGAFTSSDWSVDLGRMSTGRTVASSGDASGAQLICTRLSTNATYGAVVTVHNANGSSGLVSASTPADRIPSAAAAVTSGTPNYGLCYSTVPGDQGYDAGLTPASTSPDATAGLLDVAACTSSVASGAESVAVLTVAPQEAWRVAGVASNAFAAMRVKAAISATQPAHSDYSDSLTFVATATF